MILPPMQEGLNLSNTQTGSLATGNFLGYLSFALIGGFLASHFSPKKVISLSLLVVGLSMIFTGFSKGFVSAWILRTITGLGSGGSNVPVMGLLAAWFAVNRRGLASGIAVTGSSFGLILSGFLVPKLVQQFEASGWRVSWWVFGGIVTLISIITFLLLKDHPKEMGLSPLGSTGESTNNSQNQKKASWKDVVKSRTVWHLAVIYLLFGFSYIIYITYFAKYLQSEVGLTKEKAGQLWGIVGWISFVCGVLWGWVSDVIGRNLALACVSFLQVLSYCLFIFYPHGICLYLSVITFGLTAWSIPAIMASACGDQLGSKMASAALGFVTLFLGIGQALGPAFAGWLGDVTSSFKPGFSAAAIAAFIMGVSSLFLKKPQRNE